VTTAVAVVVVVIMVILIFVMSVGMTVAAIVVFMIMVPIARVVAIAIRGMLIVRVGPVSSGKRWPLIVPRDPVIVVSLGDPEALYPNALWCRGRRRWCLELNRRRRNADEDRNL
jgi:hypothetical protein